MKYLGKITDNKDLVTKEYVDNAISSKKIFAGTCSTAAATTEKAVTCSDFTSADLVAGVIILVKFDNTNSGAVASLALNVNSTGAMPIKYIYNGSLSNIPGAGYLKAGQMYLFYYDGTNWVVEMNYNTSGETNYTLRHYNNIKARKAITAESLIVGDSTGFEKVSSGVTFDITYPILWCTANVAQNDQNYSGMYFMHFDRNMQTGIKSGYTSTGNKVQYLVVTISGNVATIDSSIVTDTLPSTDNGKVYIELGRLGAQSTGANYFILYPSHHFWWYKNGAVRSYGDYGHAVNKDVPSDAKFTDTTYESKTAASGGTAESLVTTGEKYTWNEKQSKLVSGTNIKTINNTSLLGSGNISTTYSTATTTADGLMSSSDKTKLNGIGTIQTVNAAAKTVANNTNVSLCNITLTAGTWVVTAGVRFPANATGYRRMNLNKVNASAAADVQLPAVNGGSTQLFYTLVLQLTSSTTYHLNAWQNSGTSMNLAAGGGENGLNFIRAVRIA